ncbi:Crp/Fnr family transcriptional regulator [Cellulophaga sp. BC115SP]|uniref:Crp/Fnr family transcriptional regulator n=1 Tax=Cellulophaga sp. BC115SP TaxID=2683263 RepID=UPI001412ED53|nr:cyclic nucleotide-binding domain-containing protein [Cellulophaga sp. BC115SP]NBB27943.1 Crp/Fnr family transcriptional regulator [Cellulophaga sp. BC115SP]
MDNLDESYCLFKRTVNAFEILNQEELQKFYALFKPVTFSRKSVLTESGSTEKYLYFVVKGVQRIVFQDDLGHEATILFTYQGNFGGVLDSMLTGRATQYTYETLTKSILLRANINEVRALEKIYPAIHNLLFEGLLYAFSGLLERLVEIQCYSAEEKFRILLKRSPHILQIVPHKYLANYIGIDATNFSKLINTVKL